MCVQITGYWYAAHILFTNGQCHFLSTYRVLHILQCKMFILVDRERFYNLDKHSYLPLISNDRIYMRNYRIYVYLYNLLNRTYLEVNSIQFNRSLCYLEYSNVYLYELVWILGRNFKISYHYPFSCLLLPVLIFAHVWIYFNLLLDKKYFVCNIYWPGDK